MSVSIKNKNFVLYLRLCLCFGADSRFVYCIRFEAKFFRIIYYQFYDVKGTADRSKNLKQIVIIIG